MAYTITAIDSTTDGHLYVEVDFGTCVNDFIFVNVPEDGYGIPTDEFGRWLTFEGTKVFQEFDVPEMVQRAIASFEADIPERGHSGDMRDPSFILGGADPRGLQSKIAHLK